MNNNQMIFDIFLGLGNQFGNLFIFAFILTKVKAFRAIISKGKLTFENKIILSIIFGIFGIVGTYFSIEYNGALINTRIIGVATGGLLGGPLVGLLSGIIAGVHRSTIGIGTTTALACGLSTIFEGLMAGCMGLYVKNRSNKWIYAALTGAIAESMRKVALLIMVKPFDVALNLVKDIWMPMIVINSIGLALFFMIIDTIFKEQERHAANAAELSLKIAESALPYLKQGVKSESFGKIAKVIYEITDFDAVTVTDKDVIIAHVGIDTPRHKIGLPVVTSLTEEVLSSGKTKILDRCTEKNCECSGKCQLKSTITLPLDDGDEIVGTIKMYKTVENSITKIDEQLADGLAKLFSTEIRIAKLESRSKLLAKAELKALQSQINPHFLFNSLTVIGSLCRTNPDKARDLIYNLSTFFRKNLNSAKDDVSIGEEIDHVKAYVEIEKARFEEDLTVIYDIDESVDFQIPSLTLQPIVENAIKHGLYPKRGGGFVKIQVTKCGGDRVIRIEDNGIGFDTASLLNQVECPSRESIGLSNVTQRLKGTFGDLTSIDIDSEIGVGTVFEIRIMEEVS